MSKEFDESLRPIINGMIEFLKEEIKEKEELRLAIENHPIENHDSMGKERKDILTNVVVCKINGFESICEFLELLLDKDMVKFIEKNKESMN